VFLAGCQPAPQKLFVSKSLATGSFPCSCDNAWHRLWPSVLPDRSLRLAARTAIIIVEMANGYDPPLANKAMATSTPFSPSVWTAVDLVARFGAISLERVRTVPLPGLATERDVIEIHDRENRLCELLDGSLLEKTMGSYESYLAALICRVLGEFVQRHDLGIVLGADGMLRLARGLVRIPDVSFISWGRLPGRVFPREDIWPLAPDLAVEVISHGNTGEEMDRKLRDYFTAGVRKVWYGYPELGEGGGYDDPSAYATLASGNTIDGGELLPGLQLPLSSLFSVPGARS
jgi:Uma2 family endonuclease